MTRLRNGVPILVHDLQIISERFFARLFTIRTHLSESRLVCVHQLFIAFPGGAHAKLSFLGNIHDGLLRHLAQTIYRREKKCIMTTGFMMWDEHDVYLKNKNCYRMSRDTY